ncbi:MAG: PAS domain S-box protein [Deltaproteobacteria bacterium]|nr:PAS domain S-box protein [Deltaproteobacteria bacterium]TLN01939.1 MAG: PAS domain S-box protein [bacterium]
MKKTSRIMLLNILIVTIGIAITATFFLAQMRAEAEKYVNSSQESHLKTFWALLNSKGKGFRISDGKMFVGDYLLNDNYEIPDTIKDLFGGTATIFLGDTRISTNVLKEDGSRAVGTKLIGPAYDALFRHGKSYRGEAEILNIPYFTAYDPIRDSSGRIIGALFVGSKKSDFFAAYDAIRSKAIFVALVLMALFSCLAYLILRMERLTTKAIEKSEHKYRILFSRMLNGFAFHEMLYDENGAASDYRFLEVNPAFEKITGLSAKNTIGRTLREVMTGSVEEWIKIYEPIARFGNSLRFERYSSELGKHFEIVAFSPEKGTFATIFSDITDRKVAEERLQEQLHLLQSIIDAIPNPVYYKDISGRYLGCNLAFSHHLGKERAEIIGKTVFDINPEEFASVFHRMDAALLMNPGQQTYDSVVQYMDAGLRNVIFSKATFTNHTGNVQGIVGVIVDITERKQAEENLRDNEEKYRKLSMEFQALLEAIPDAVILYSPDLQIRWANRNACQSLEMNPEEILNKSCYAAWHHENKPCTVCPVQRSFQSGKSESEEMSFSDGTIRDIHTAPVFDEEGAVIGVVGITRDITSQRKLETQLNHLQKMDAIGQLAGGIAHDFNNILTAIIGYGHLLQLKTPSEAPTRKYIDNIMFASERAADLTKNLLAFSRKQAFHPQPSELNEIINTLDSILSRLIREDIELRKEIHPFDLTVMVDVGQLEQVLINLVTNARDAMPNGGSILIKTIPVHLENEFIEAFGFGTPGNYATVSISDSGIGLDESTRERIFEPFFTTKDKGKGTGLGLAIVYGIIKQHNGYISVESEQGHGTTFTVYLPLVQDGAKSANEVEEQESYPGSEVVLLAEDEEELRELYRSVLEENGYTVLEAANGEEAIDIFLINKNEIELLILDVIMPRRNARDVYEAVKRENPAVKFLFVSGHGKETIHDSGIQGENVTILTKPSTLPKFLKTVRDVLDA